MNSDKYMSNNLVTIFCTPGIAGFRNGYTLREITFPPVNNVSDWEHPEPSFTFVHSILRFHIEYFSETSINDALKGQIPQGPVEFKRQKDNWNSLRQNEGRCR